MRDLDEAGCFALKVSRSLDDDDDCFIPMGPAFPEGDQEPRILNWVAETVVSFGRDFLVELPVQLDCWQLEEPPTGTPCLAVEDDQVFIRANSATSSSRFERCFVKLDDGSVVARVSGVSAYAVRWRLLVRVSELLWKPALDMPG